MRSRVLLLTIPGFAVVAALAVAGNNPSSASPVSQGDSLAVAKVVKDFHNALASGDSAKALSLLANDAVILESGGIEPRSEYRSHHLAVDIEFAKSVAAKRAPLQITVKGGSAWTVGTSTARGMFKGKAIDSIGAESMVLTKETRGWRIRSIHWSSRTRSGAT